MNEWGRALLDRGFGHPAVLFGRLGSRLMAHGDGPTERHIVELAAPRPDETVLVIGPGPGVGVVAAAATAGRVIAVDPSSQMLETCRRRCARTSGRGVGVELHRGTAEDTGQPDAAADVVISVNNVMLWPDRPAGTAELHRVLRPGGRLLVSMHAKRLPGGASALAPDTQSAGFANIELWYVAVVERDESGGYSAWSRTCRAASPHPPITTSAYGL